MSVEVIVSKYFSDDVTDSTRSLVSKLRGRGFKRVRQEKRGGKKTKNTPAKRARVIKGISYPNLFSYTMSTAWIASISNFFDIFAHKPVQTSEPGTIETANKPIVPVDQNDL